MELDFGTVPVDTAVEHPPSYQGQVSKMILRKMLERLSTEKAEIPGCALHPLSDSYLSDKSMRSSNMC